MGRAFEFRKARKMKRWSAMSKAFTRIGKDIVIAVKEGGPDPDSNSKLRAVIQNAKSVNMPKDNIDRAIRRASDKSLGNYKEILFEGYAPYGVAILVETATDNNTRTVANIRSYFNKCNGSLATSGSVEFLFNRYSTFKIENNVEQDDLEFELIDYGLEEIVIDNDKNHIIIYASFDSFGEIQSELEKRNIIIINSGFERIANNYKDLNEDQKSDIDKLLEMCEGDDDVQNVYHNIGNS